MTAEGVEQPQTVELLTGFDCDKIHGYYLTPALDYQAIPSWYRKFTILADDSTQASCR